MRSHEVPLLLALSLVAMACAGAESGQVVPQAPAAPVVVDITPAPNPPPGRTTPTPAPSADAAEAKPPLDATLAPAAQFGMIGLIGAGADPNAPTAPWAKDAAGADPSAASGGLHLPPGGGAVRPGTGPGGLASLGPGAASSGDTIGLAGIGSGLGQGATPPSIRMGATSVIGKLPPEVVQRIVRQSFGRFRLCYASGLRDKPKLQGGVAVKFVIGKDGAVSGAADAGSDLPDAAVVACVVRSFSALSFPQPEDGTVVVVYPMLLRPGEPAPPKPSPSGTAGTAPGPAPARPEPAKTP